MIMVCNGLYCTFLYHQKKNGDFPGELVQMALGITRMTIMTHLWKISENQLGNLENPQRLGFLAGKGIVKTCSASITQASLGIHRQESYLLIALPPV